MPWRSSPLVSWRSACGIALVQAMTPSAISLGPLLARQLAQQDAIDAFWLGPWAGADLVWLVSRRTPVGARR